jgi:hypothetical protein
VIVSPPGIPDNIEQKIYKNSFLGIAEFNQLVENLKEQCKKKKVAQHNTSIGKVSL